MATEAISVLLRVRKADGARTYYQAVIGANGRLKPFWGVVDGSATHLPGSVYYLRYRVNGKREWEHAGDDPAHVLTLKQKREHQLAGLRLGVEAPGLGRPSPSLTPSTPVPSQGRLTVAVAIDTHVHAIEQIRGARTGNSYRQHLTTFINSCPKQFMDELTRQDVQAYILSEKLRGMSPKTIDNRLVTLKAFLRKFGQDGKIVVFTDAPRVPKKLPHVYTRKQIADLMAVSGAEDQLVWQVFIAAGLREQELSHLCWEDVNFEQGWLHLRAKREFGFQLKDAEERQIPLPSKLLARLAERRTAQPNTRLVFGTLTGKPDGHLLRRLKDLVFSSGLNCGRCVNRAGVSCKGKPVCGGWTLHSFRRTAATRWHEAGMTVRTVQRLLGHSDIETTMRYLGIQDFGSAEFRSSVESAFEGVCRTDRTVRK